MSDLIDKVIFSDLVACDPADVTDRTGCPYDEQTNRYTVQVWGRKFAVDLNAFKVSPLGEGFKTYHDFLYLFILYHLIKSKKTGPSGEWISEKDIPGGAAFFRGPHTIPTDMITGRFKNDLDAFRKKCELLGGKKLDMADAAFAFSIVPSIPVSVLYFLGDEDFPSEAKLLFDRTIGDHQPLDIIFTLAVEVCSIVSMKDGY